MNGKEFIRIWHLGLAAGIMFGFGANAMEVWIPAPGLRMYVKLALLMIACLLILCGYGELRKVTGQDACPDTANSSDLA